MPITTILDTHTVAQLVGLLNDNFSYLQSVSGGAGKYVANLSGVTGATAITHSLNSQDLIVQAWDSSGALVFAPVQINTANQITITFDTSFTGRVIVRT